jgi:hypothetical protein
MKGWPGASAAAGALFAAWLAFDAIQEQILREAERRKVEQAEAKISAVVCITPLIHAAAESLFWRKRRGVRPKPVT